MKKIRFTLALVIYVLLVSKVSAFYDPHIGRFLSRDPIAEEGGLNLYAYVGNNPINYTDPLGEKKVTETRQMLVTAYSDKGPGSDWAYYKGKGPNGGPGSVGPGTVATANAEHEEWLPQSPATPYYPYGTEVEVYDNNGNVVYKGTVHDTGAGWDTNHFKQDPADWIDVWLPTKAQAKKWGKPTLKVKLTYDDGCP